MQLKKSGKKNTNQSYFATTTNTANQSSEDTGQKRPSMVISENLLPTPQAMDSTERTLTQKREGGASLVETMNLLPTPQANDTGRTPEQYRRHQQALSALPVIIQTVTSSQEDSHVNHSLMQAKEGGKMITAFFGQRCLSVFGSSNPHGLLRKMFTESLVLKMDWSSSRSALTWKKKVTKYGRSLFQLVPSTLHTEEIEYGLLATPNTMDNMDPKSEKALWKEATQDRRNRMKPGNLRDQLSNQETWDKFGKRNYDQMLPTTQARDWKGRSQRGDWKETDAVPNMIDHLGKETGNKLRLQPAFVEWMMGYPDGWTTFAFPKPNKEQKD